MPSPRQLCTCGNPKCKIPYGFCHCGCGQETAIASRSDRHGGCAADHPYRFLHGHATRHQRPDPYAGYVGHESVVFVPLNHGKWTIVSRRDFKSIRHVAWTYATNGYAVAQIGGCQVRMHRFILGLKRDDPDRDHRNRNKLDNRRRNLRPATTAQNQWNVGITARNTSGYKGVDFVRAISKWRAMISINRKRIFLGHFETAKEAAVAYNRAAKRYHQQYDARGAR